MRLVDTIEQNRKSWLQLLMQTVQGVPCCHSTVYNKHIQTSDKHNYIYSTLALSQHGWSFVCSRLKWFILALQVHSIYIYNNMHI